MRRKRIREQGREREEEEEGGEEEGKRRERAQRGSNRAIGVKVS